jgi:SAM-dependent methyltransferase
MNAPPDFNRLARLYRWMELATFGPALWHARCAFLAQTADARNALVLGDGDGRFTARLLETNSAIRIDAVDASAAMLAVLQRRAGSQAARVRTYNGDARSFHPPNPPYDLIVTHFFLDCLTTSEIAALAHTLQDNVSPGALWLVSEFVVPPGTFGRLIATPIVAALYRAFGLLTGLRLRELPDNRSALRQAGFTLQAQHPRLAGLLVSELWAERTELHRIT